jgi:hypothetical protein
LRALPPLAGRPPHLVLAASAGALLALGWFGPAAAALAAALLAGLTARRRRAPRRAEAVIAASADRYAELLVLGGLAAFFRFAVAPLALVLLAIAGAYMASYAMAKAEAHGARARAEPADGLACVSTLTVGVVLVPVAQLASTVVALPPWAAHAPLIVALTTVAVAGNVSAIVRLRAVAASAQRHERHDGPAALLDVDGGVAKHTPRIDVHRVLPGRDPHPRDGDPRGERLPAPRVGGI